MWKRFLENLKLRNHLFECKDCNFIFKWKNRGKDGTRIYDFNNYDCCPNCEYLSSTNRFGWCEEIKN
jgi:hypothetical protein